MKTLLVLLTAGTLSVAAPEPEVVKTPLIGITTYYNSVLSIEWDLNGDDKEDLRVFYHYIRDKGSIFTKPKPWGYWQDLNNNNAYEDSEKFLYNNK